uniref:Attachment glycoprotein n=1 Tax=Gerbil paramyxovirus TaxID=2942127 RepID=A0A977NV73_9MONO|nr:attachment glycoprotein [Gerbil paramyxovirus]
MNQLAAHNLVMSNFYGIPQTGVHDLQKDQDTGIVKTVRYVSMIVGLLSLFTIIALNVANIIYMTESGGTMGSIKQTQESLAGYMRETSGTILEDIKPKTDLINTMVSYNIPAQIAMIHQLIRNDVLKQCTPSFMFNNTICPIAENPRHTDYWEEINLSSFSACRPPNAYLKVVTPIEFQEYPSFIPGSTKPGSCTRLPSFSMSKTVYGYTHTVMGHGCSEVDIGDHYLSIGRVADSNHEVPYLQTITQWFFNDKINRRSCTVAAGNMEVWMGCVIMSETFIDDVNSEGTSKISVSYMDVFGRKREWIYTRSEIQYDYTYTSLYFSIGSGIVTSDYVYFLVWGSLLAPINVNAWCVAPGCPNPDQRTCNQAQKPQTFGSHQMVNAILSFRRDTTGKPLITVVTITPDKGPFGTEGRLYYFYNSKKTFIYLRSTTWHSLPLIGELTLRPALAIRWVVMTSVSRPGDYPCGASNRCPRECVTGVYSDIYPLNEDFTLGVTAFLNAELYRVNPTIAIVNSTSRLTEKVVTDNHQRAAYTTTTCFIYKLRLWCLSIIELSPATITSYEAVPFLYYIDLQCQSLTSNITIPLTGDSGDYKAGRLATNMNECYFERIRDKYYFVLSTPASIQAYEIRDLMPDRVEHVGIYALDLCPLLVNAYLQLKPQVRRLTTMTIGNWQFRPVTITGGIKMIINQTRVFNHSLFLRSPEDPGMTTFPGYSKGSDYVEGGKLCMTTLKEVCDNNMCDALIDNMSHQKIPHQHTTEAHEFTSHYINKYTSKNNFLKENTITENSMNTRNGKKDLLLTSTISPNLRTSLPTSPSRQGNPHSQSSTTTTTIQNIPERPTENKQDNKSKLDTNQITQANTNDIENMPQQKATTLTHIFHQTYREHTQLPRTTTPMSIQKTEPTKATNSPNPDTTTGNTMNTYAHPSSTTLKPTATKPNITVPSKISKTQQDNTETARALIQHNHQLLDTDTPNPQICTSATTRHTPEQAHNPERNPSTTTAEPNNSNPDPQNSQTTPAPKNDHTLRDKNEPTPNPISSTPDTRRDDQKNKDPTKSSTASTHKVTEAAPTSTITIPMTTTTQAHTASDRITHISTETQHGTSTSRPPTTQMDLKTKPMIRRWVYRREEKSTTEDSLSATYRLAVQPRVKVRTSTQNTHDVTCISILPKELCNMSLTYHSSLSDSCDGVVSVNTMTTAIGVFQSNSMDSDYGMAMLPPIYYSCEGVNDTYINQFYPYRFNIGNSKDSKVIGEGKFLTNTEAWDGDESVYPKFPFSKMDLYQRSAKIINGEYNYGCVLINLCGYPIIAVQTIEETTFYYITKGNNNISMVNETKYSVKSVCWVVLNKIMNIDASGNVHKNIPETIVNKGYILHKFEDGNYASWNKQGGLCVDWSSSNRWIYYMIEEEYPSTSTSNNNDDTGGATVPSLAYHQYQISSAVKTYDKTFWKALKDSWIGVWNW